MSENLTPEELENIAQEAEEIMTAEEVSEGTEDD